MDLGTIKQRLENDEYESLDQAAADMRLVWTNCMSYNQDGSEFYFLADTFARKFEEMYAAVMPSESRGILISLLIVTVTCSCAAPRRERRSAT